MDNRFHLQRLPLVAIEEVFKLMNPFEIMQFAQISNRSKRLVQCVMKFRRFNTELSIGDPTVFNISVGHITRFYYNLVPDYEIQETVEYTEMEDGDMYEQTEYSEGWEKLKMIVDFANECLKLEIYHFEFDLDYFPEKNREITSWVKSLYPTIPSITLWGKDVSHDDVNYCLAELYTTDWSIFVETKNNMAVRVPRPLHSLKIKSAKWVGLEQLLEFDTMELEIWDGILKTEELKVFLEKFKNLECHNKLELFYYQMESWSDFNRIVEGIENTSLDPKKTIENRKSSSRYETSRSEYETERWNNCHNVFRRDRWPHFRNDTPFSPMNHHHGTFY